MSVCRVEISYCTALAPIPPHTVQVQYMSMYMSGGEHPGGAPHSLLQATRWAVGTHSSGAALQRSQRLLSLRVDSEGQERHRQYCHALRMCMCVRVCNSNGTGALSYIGPSPVTVPMPLALEPTVQSVGRPRFLACVAHRYISYRQPESSTQPRAPPGAPPQRHRTERTPRVRTRVRRCRKQALSDESRPPRRPRRG